MEECSLPPKILGGGQNPNTGGLNFYQDKTSSSWSLGGGTVYASLVMGVAE